jgi:hypothetical protein
MRALRVMPAIVSSVLLALSACQPAPNTETSSAGPQVVIQGERANVEVIQSIEIDNCDGKSDATRIEQRTQSVEVTISAEVAATFGVSVEVLSAEVQGVVGSAIGVKGERSTQIQLSAPPGTRMFFQLLWIGEEQVGVVQNLRGSNIPIVFQSFIPADVRIKSQQDIGCPGSGIAQPVVTSQPIPTQTSTSAQPVQSDTALINRLFLGLDVSLSSLTRDIQSPSQVSQEQLESVVRIIQSEADRLHGARVESNSTTLSANDWWLAWCSNVPAQYSQLPAGWSYLFGQKLPTFGQLYVISPTAQNRVLESCNSPKGWWAVVVYLNNP